MPDVDQGNAGSWWRPYIGKYELQLSDGVTMGDTTVMLSTILDVIFTSDMVIPSTLDGAIAVLPEECRPSTDIYMSVLYTDSATMGTAILVAKSTGELVRAVMEPIQGETFILHTSAQSFNICGRYYSTSEQGGN